MAGEQSGSIQGVLGRLSILYWGIFFFYYHQQGTGQADYFLWKLYTVIGLLRLCVLQQCNMECN